MNYYIRVTAVAVVVAVTPSDYTNYLPVKDYAG